MMEIRDKITEYIIRESKQGESMEDIREDLIRWIRDALLESFPDKDNEL